MTYIQGIITSASVHYDSCSVNRFAKTDLYLQKVKIRASQESKTMKNAYSVSQKKFSPSCNPHTYLKQFKCAGTTYWKAFSTSFACVATSPPRFADNCRYWDSEPCMISLNAATLILSVGSSVSSEGGGGCCNEGSGKCSGPEI